MNKLITIGQLLDQTWDHYRENFKDLISVSAWILILALVDVLALSFYPSASKLAAGAVLTGSEIFGVILASVSSALLAPLLGLWLLIALTRLVRTQLAGRKNGVKTAILDGFKLFWPALYISILIAAVLIAILALCLGPAFILAAILRYSAAGAFVALFNLLLILGLAAALALVAAFGVQIIFAPFALLLEDKRGLSALLRSRELVRGRFWSVVLRLVVPKLIFLCVGVLILAVIQYAADLGILSAAGLNLDLRVRLNSLTQAAVSVMVVALINPLVVIADLILYKSLLKK